MLANPPEMELAVVQLVRVMERAEAGIEARLNATSGPVTRRVRTQRRGEIRAILGALRELLNPNAGTEAGPLWDLVRTAYRTGSDRALEGIGARGVEKSLGGIHLDAARILFENAAAAFDNALDHVGRRADDVFRRVALQEITTSELSGRDRRATSGAIERNLRGRGIRAFTDSRGAAWKLSTYSELVARTTSREAHTTGTLNRLTSNGIDTVRWITGGGEKACEPCQSRHRKVYSITGATEGYPVLTEAPPLHPNCLVPGQLVSAPGLEASSERWYEGEVVVVRTSAGDEITCTPNHPVLTSGGWVAAGLLEEGGDVIRSTDLQGMMQTVDPDYDDVPALIEDVARSVEMAGGVSSRSVPVAPEDFHGDGSGSEVAVVRANGLLRGRADMTLFEQLAELYLCPAHAELFALPGGGALDLLADGMGSPAYGFMGGGGVPAALFGGHSGGADEVLLGAGSRLNAEFGKPSVNQSATNTVPFGEGINALPRFVEPTQIVKVKRDSFHGYVYNLQTKAGWYMCNNIITHNCRCVAAPFIEALAA